MTEACSGHQNMLIVQCQLWEKENNDLIMFGPCHLRDAASPSCLLYYRNLIVRTSNNTAVSSTVTGQSVASSGSDEPSRVPVV